MNLSKDQLWQRFKQYYFEFADLGLALDLSRMSFSDEDFATMAQPMQRAFAAMRDLENGAIANPDEKRMVGHYWLRAPALAPRDQPQIRQDIESTLAAIHEFARKVHAGTIHGPKGAFKSLLLIGIGGSALGPQFVAHALGQPTRDRLKLFFFDNTDPEGMDRVLAAIPDLAQTLCVVISKSGGTKETRNGMLEAQRAFEKQGLKFPAHAVAITQVGSALHKLSTGWLAQFPMWDWVGGRTSQTSAVGLLPAALQGLDIDELLKGARACDQLTRNYESVGANPAALLALAWYFSGNGRGTKDMVILPYKDRLELFSRYLQQLIMESLGKRLDLDQRIVNQGIAVYGNKGSTDQHAYVQQLRDGVPNFFATFIEVLRDRADASMLVEENVTSGDFLHGFFLGTRQALHEQGRDSVTLTISEVSPFTVGMLIALFERTVGFYASLVNINAYHQPGVEAGKKAADTVIGLKLKVQQYLADHRGQALTAEQIAHAIGAPTQAALIYNAETVFKVCEHLAANPQWALKKTPGPTPFEARYQV